MSNYRQDFLSKLDGGAPLYDEELLKILLSNAFGGKDMSDTAAKLCSYFPSLGAILRADYDEIAAVDGVSKSVAEYLHTVGRLDALINSRPDKISGDDGFLTLAVQRLKDKDCEAVELYFLNKNGKVLDIKTYTSHRTDTINVSAAELMSAISNSGAHKMYCAHNHVIGSCNPSEADDATTLRLISACKICNVIFGDHCIVNSSGEIYSYRKSGKLDELTK
ncbi:MAG: hypothetical protein K2O67_02155 [Clostridia bacterium]|nr:hypothetical protein [Clostridia bacterium]